MGMIQPKTEDMLRHGFKYMNRFMLTMWKLGLGNWVNYWPEGTGRIMVLTHIGRKTGARRQTPVNYALIEGDIYCTAAFGATSDWYLNLRANPNVEVWLPEGWWDGQAKDISDHKDRLKILREVLINSGFAARAAGIDPVAFSDEKLGQATSAYRLVQIRRTTARTGPGGPGELAWIWPMLTFVLLLNLLIRPRRR